MFPHQARDSVTLPVSVADAPGTADGGRHGDRGAGRAGPTPRGRPNDRGHARKRPVPPVNTSPVSHGISPAPEPVLDMEATLQTMDPADELLTPAKVAQMFGVDPKTVTRWADSGRLGFIRTPGGHRRFRRSEITALLADNGHHAS